MLKRFLSIMVLLALCVACGQNKQEELILGNWYNESMMVELDAKSGRIDSVFNVPASQWEAILNIKPIETNYATNGEYSSDYINLMGELLQTSTGQWELKDDTLYLTEQGKTTAYHFSWLEGKAIFRGYLDWDNDGFKDDLYTGVQIKK